MLPFEVGIDPLATVSPLRLITVFAEPALVSVTRAEITLPT
jgi:hypothetical protein